MSKRKASAAPPPPIDLNRVDLAPLAASVADLLRNLDEGERRRQALALIAAHNSWTYAAFAALAAEQELSRIGWDPDPEVPRVRGGSRDRMNAVVELDRWLRAMRGVSLLDPVDGWGQRATGAWAEPIPPSAENLERPLRLLRWVHDALQAVAGTAPLSPTPGTAEGDPPRPQTEQRARPLSELEVAAKRLREEILPNGKQRTFGQVADALNDQGLRKRNGKPHDAASAKAAYRNATAKR